MLFHMDWPIVLPDLKGLQCLHNQYALEESIYILTCGSTLTPDCTIFCAGETLRFLKCTTVFHKSRVLLLDIFISLFCAVEYLALNYYPVSSAFCLCTSGMELTVLYCCGRL
jgi:hypothetical protein